jgi:superfamily I DNA/RNA helicase
MAEPTQSPAPDQDARDRIAVDLDTTLFVEAGAGSGKTSALVGRVLALVTDGKIELRHIAAITFTEKAGASYVIASATSLKRKLAMTLIRSRRRSAGWPWISSMAPPLARCTHLPNGSCPNIR